MIIPLLKHFSLHEGRSSSVTLFFMYAQDKKKEGIVNFESTAVDNGFVAPDMVARLLGPEIMEYVKGAFEIEVFIYQDQKAKSLTNIGLSRRLWNRLRRYDLIHVNGIGGTLYHLLPLLRFKKWVFTVHDFKPHSGEGTRTGSKLLENALQRAPRVIIQNRPDYQDIMANHADLAAKTVLVPFGYLDIYRAFLQQDDAAALPSDLLFFGRISKYKGLEYLLEALEILGEQGLHPRVVIAGGGDYDFGVDRLPAFEQLHFINRYVANDQLAKLICNTRLVVCPYTDATQSGVLMTAFAFGRPVIATAVGGFKDAVVEGVNGRLVPPRDSPALAAALKTLLIQPGVLEQLGQNIRTYEGLPQFRWQTIAGQLEEVYRSMF